MKLEMVNIGHLDSFDDNEKTRLWIAVRSAAKERRVFLTLSLESGSDLDVTLDADTVRGLIQLLETALKSLHE